MNYQLRRMKRKTVGIYITKEGEIEVRAPRSVSEAEIDRLVQEKEAWITTHQTKMRERIQLQAMDRIRPGGTVIFLGRSYPAEPSQARDISFNGTRFLLPDLPEAELRAALVDFYRKAAKAILPSAVERFAPLVGKAPQQVRITSAKTRWGSCSAKGGLNFSWRLLCAPGSNGLRCRPRACASDRIQSLFSFLGNCRRNSAGLQGPPPILERSAGEPPKAGMVKRMREIHKSILLLMQWKERSG